VPRDVIGICLKGGIGAGKGVGKAASRHQIGPRSELNFYIIGEEIGGTHVFAECVARLPGFAVALGELRARGAKSRVDLNGVAIFHDGFSEFAFVRVTVAAFEVLLLPSFRTSSAPGNRDQ
jgi:hypothetical protein